MKVGIDRKQCKGIQNKTSELVRRDVKWGGHLHIRLNNTEQSGTDETEVWEQSKLSSLAQDNGGLGDESGTQPGPKHGRSGGD